MPIRFVVMFACVGLFVPTGCRTKYREDLDYSYAVEQTWPLDELNFGEIVQFESVFWEPDDTVSLRKLIVDDGIATGRRVLEIGTGTGMIAVLCLQYEATVVVATDINPAAVANAKYNAAILASDRKLDVRQVSPEKPDAFAVIQDKEKFDLIISNPPWEDGTVAKPADHAFYDPGFALMETLLDGLPAHLNPGGRCLLAYGHLPAIERLKVEAEKRGYQFKILDDRSLDSLERDFLPGMLVEIRPPLPPGLGKKKKSRNATASKPTNTETETVETESAETDTETEPTETEPTETEPTETEPTETVGSDTTPVKDGKEGEAGPEVTSGDGAA